MLDLRASTVSHHVGKLKGAGLVSMHIEGNDHLYRLNARTLETMSKEVFSRKKMGAPAGEVECDVWERLDGGTVSFRT